MTEECATTSFKKRLGFCRCWYFSARCVVHKMYEALAAVEHVCGREHYFRMVCLCDEMFRQKEVDRRLQNSAAHFVRLFLSLTEYSLLYFRFVVMFMMRKE